MTVFEKTKLKRSHCKRAFIRIKSILKPKTLLKKTKTKLYRVLIQNSSLMHMRRERQSYEQKLLKILEEKTFMDLRTER